MPERASEMVSSAYVILLVLYKVIQGYIDKDNGKENGNYYSMLGLYGVI